MVLFPFTSFPLAPMPGDPTATIDFQHVLATILGCHVEALDHYVGFQIAEGLRGSKSNAEYLHAALLFLLNEKGFWPIKPKFVPHRVYTTIVLTQPCQSFRVDILGDKGVWLFCVEIAGVTGDSVNFRLFRDDRAGVDKLIIYGNRKRPALADPPKYMHREIGYGGFFVYFDINIGIEPRIVHKSSSDGIHSVFIVPRPARDAPTRAG